MHLKVMPLGVTSCWLLHSWHVVCADQRGPSMASYQSSLCYSRKLVNKVVHCQFCGYSAPNWKRLVRTGHGGAWPAKPVG